SADRGTNRASREQPQLPDRGVRILRLAFNTHCERLRLPVRGVLRPLDRAVVANAAIRDPAYPCRAERRMAAFQSQPHASAAVRTMTPLAQRTRTRPCA